MKDVMDCYGFFDLFDELRTIPPVIATLARINDLASIARDIAILISDDETSSSRSDDIRDVDQCALRLLLQRLLSRP